MSTETTPAEVTVATKKSAPAAKKSAKKAPAAKTTKVAKKAVKGTKKGAKKEAKEPRVTTRLRVFQLLKKHPNGMTVPAIKEALSLSGAPSFVKHEALAKKPRIIRGKEDGSRGVVYSLTALGRKALENDTVDSEVPESSVGTSELRG